MRKYALNIDGTIGNASTTYCGGSHKKIRKIFLILQGARFMVNTSH